MVLATIFLVIIGMSAGFTLGARHKRHVADQARNNPVVSVVTTAPAWADAEPCRTETQQIAPQYGAQGELTIALLLRTRKSTVWICRDSAGALFYHANRGGAGAIWIEGKTALFMNGVQAAGDGYQVTAADGTEFSITPRRLEIVHKDGQLETQDAVN